MSGKTALVTGSSRGIGLAFCRELHHRGWKVIATCRNPDSIQAEPFYKKMRLAVDDDKSIEKMAKELEGEPIDLLINNAGILTRGMDSLETFDREKFLHEFNIDAISPMMVTKALAANLLACQGNVINISSLMGSISDAGMPRNQAYRAAKAALNMLTRMVHLEMKDRLGYVVAFHPGLVATDMVGGPRAGAISAEEAASAILSSLKALTPEKNGCLLSRHGNVEPW